MRLKSLRKNKKGFTLVELVVVLAIIAIMVAVTVPQFIGYVEKANQRMEELETRNAALITELEAIEALVPAD